MQKTVQAFVHAEQEPSDGGGEESNYIPMQGHSQGEYSLADQQIDESIANESDIGGSIILGVPNTLRRQEDAVIKADGVESLYNHTYASQSLMKVC